MKFSVAHEFPMTPAQFWKNLYDPAYDAYIETDLEFRERRILEVKEDEKQISRRISTLPKRTWPAIIEKVFGDGFGFVEESTWVKGTNVMAWRTIPNRMADRVKAAGTLHVAELGANRIQRVVEGDVDVRLFGVGGIVESIVLKSIEETYVRAAASLNRWLETHTP
ncbi:MAG: DUF2505 family protein [Deltaproteobacteria bacterium]|nr:DUF2505 family protein [Deltaproteobacteria bacterium]